MDVAVLIARLILEMAVASTIFHNAIYLVRCKSRPRSAPSSSGAWRSGNMTGGLPERALYGVAPLWLLSELPAKLAYDKTIGMVKATPSRVRSSSMQCRSWRKLAHRRSMWRAYCVLSLYFSELQLVLFSLKCCFTVRDQDFERAKYLPPT